MAAATEVAAARPRMQEPHEAARSLAVVDAPLPQTTANVNSGGDSQRERLPQTTANRSEAARSLAVVDALIDDADLEGDWDLFQDVDSKLWRIEKRYRVRQDGRTVMYYNFRRRQISRVDGKQRVEYWTGGKRIVR